jgi:uncharacterized repeat protein (TIGR03803 family)
VLFSFNALGEYRVLHDFARTDQDGGGPQTGVVRDPQGNLYGTTTQGGIYDFGTVYKFDSSGTETVLHSFNGTDGSEPLSDLLLGPGGNLYGATDSGGYTSCYYCGVVFKLEVSSGKYSVLHRFRGPDGIGPIGRLVADAEGNLYGTTSQGGTPRTGCGGTGCGLVFKLDRFGSFAVLHNFTGTDGANPLGGLIRDPNGNFYGVTIFGGTWSNGTVFKLDTNNNLTVLHSFNLTDGSEPAAPVVRDSQGNLYGTAYVGGLYDQGVVFKIMP